jgi:hypothetical protein
MLERIVNPTVPTPGTPSDFEKRFLRERVTGAAVLAAASDALEINLISATPAAGKLVSANIGIQVTQAAAANSHDYRIYYDDGAGGSAVALTSLYDGSATAVTANVLNAFTVTAGVAIPAGSRVYVVTAKSGCGAAANLQFEATLEYT